MTNFNAAIGSLFQIQCSSSRHQFSKRFTAYHVGGQAGQHLWTYTMEWNSVWTEAHDAALTAHVLKGNLSYLRIADAINEQFGTTYSRNAAIGRAGRLRLSNPHSVKSVKPNCKAPDKPLPKPLNERKQQPVFKAVSPVGEPVVLRVVDIVPRNLPLLDLDPDDCRYPVTDDLPFLFCGHPKHEGSSYCAAHHRLTTYKRQDISDAERQRRANLFRRVNHYGIREPA